MEQFQEQNEEQAASEPAEQAKISEPENIYAVIHVKYGKEDLGEIKIDLLKDQAPFTVYNFIGLAEGTKEFVDPKTGQKIKKRFYDGLIFHRVIDGFMIQGGDPRGNGRGGPGYKFEDEINKDLVFDQPGLLAMANAGPNTNGSQFFITVAPTPWLNGKHTIFGKIVGGMNIVNKIAALPVGNENRPLTPVIMDRVEIERK